MIIETNLKVDKDSWIKPKPMQGSYNSKAKISKEQ